jgi:hypothetical protein
MEDEGPVKEFKYKRDLKKWMEKKDLEDDDITLDMRRIVEPKHFALHIVKQTLQKIKDRTGAKNLKIFLTRSPGYRKMLVPEYKANRKDARRPFWEEEIREYLITKHGAVEVDWIEADDAMGIAQYEQLEMQAFQDYGIHDPDYATSVICTSDKDLNMIPGWHYDWTKDYTEEVDGEVPPPPLVWMDELEGMRFFYKQLIIGDTADNVKGIPRKGPAYANKLLDICETVEEMYEAVRGAYQGHFGEEADKQLLLNATALWILREEHGYWSAEEFECNN